MRSSKSQYQGRLGHSKTCVQGWRGEPWHKPRNRRNPWDQTKRQQKSTTVTLQTTNLNMIFVEHLCKQITMQYCEVFHLICPKCQEESAQTKTNPSPCPFPKPPRSPLRGLLAISSWAISSRAFCCVSARASPSLLGSEIHVVDSVHPKNRPKG